MKVTSGLFCIVPLFIISVVSADACIRYDRTGTCTSYPITDFYFSLPVGQSSDNSIIRDIDMATSLGWMFVLNERIDLGPSLFFSAYRNGGWHNQVGVRANLRYHLDDEFHLDFSPGLILSDSPFPDGFAGYTAEFSVSWKDWLGLATRLDFVDTFESGHDQVLQIGLRFGSYAGMGLTAAGTIGGGIAYMASQMD